ncbi:MAG: hypothetical protein MJZ90_04670 [Bacteroidales bacterium]|nr:hypothetical protein [Bacteroidales bacterium]
MKKILIAVMMSCCMAFCVSAQSTDSFFSDYYSGDISSFSPEFPEYHGRQIDYNMTPIESGIVVFSILGMGYATIKRTRKIRQ